jgi:hypothetical protein
MKIIGETALLCQKMKKMHAVSMIPHAQSTNVSRPWQPVNGISIKNIYFQELPCPNPPLQKEIHLKGLSNKNKNSAIGDLKVEYLSRKS